jgi:hypothetical protein
MARYASYRPSTEPEPSWRTESVTAKQIEALERRGIEFDPGITKGWASDLLD